MEIIAKRIYVQECIGVFFKFVIFTFVALKFYFNIYISHEQLINILLYVEGRQISVY